MSILSIEYNKEYKVLKTYNSINHKSMLRKKLLILLKCFLYSSGFKPFSCNDLFAT